MPARRCNAATVLLHWDPPPRLHAACHIGGMTEAPKSRGIRWFGGGDFRIVNLTLKVADDGAISMGDVRAELRTDMWPFWLEEAIDAAVLASGFAGQIPTLVGQRDSAAHPNPIEHEIDQLVLGEMKASMRAITSSAFAIDAFYASVKERSPEHPDAQKWREKRTAREKQVTETFRYHLRITKADAVAEIKRRVSEIFRFRDWAVHPGAKFQQPEYRDDLNLAMDWHFVAFRRANAIGATALTVGLLDTLVAALDRGSDELKTMKQHARHKMDEILDACEALDEFPPVGRAEPPTEPTPPV